MRSGLVVSNAALSGFNVKKYKAVSPRLFGAIVALAKKLKRVSIIHVSATPSGGGVAELLRSQIAFENAVGLKSYWCTIQAPKQFFVVTKRIHNLLQGRQGMLSASEQQIYEEANQQIGTSADKIFGVLKPTIVIVHDPQPMPLIHSVPPRAHSIARVHIDLSTPNLRVLEFLKPWLGAYSRVVLSSTAYQDAFSWLPKQKVKIILPAIDPFTEKNKDMELSVARKVLEEFGINTVKPIVSQVSRFDAWKDPLGVISAYYLAKNKIPDLQLVLAGFLIAQDDPEAVEIFARVARHARGDNDIHLFVNLKQLGSVSNDTFINAIYTASTVMLQKSLREGFGLTITEGMWKQKAVVAGTTIGAKLQIQHAKNGMLASSPKETANAIVRLVRDESLRMKLGRAARTTVVRKFLLPRSIFDHLKLYAGVCAMK